MQLGPEETVASGAGVLSLFGAIAWLRSIGSRITKLEYGLNKITDVEDSPFVLSKTCDKACKDLQSTIKGTNDNVTKLTETTAKGFKDLTKYLNDLNCAKKLMQERAKEE